MEVAPDLVQPVKLPVSKPPLTITVADGGLTTRVTPALWLRLPLVPVMVMANEPVAAVDVVLTVSVDVPLPLTEVGLNEPEAPAPNPAALRLTVPVNPFTAATVTA